MNKRLLSAVCLTAALVLAAGCFAGCTPKLTTAAEVYNVLDYGAKGNGSTDDSTAIYNLIGDISAKGGTIVFPKGNYYIEEDTLSFSTKISVVMLDGAYFTVAEDTAVKVYTGSFDAPKECIFRGDGDVTGLAAVPNVWVEWFGAVADDDTDDSDAIYKALKTGGRISFGEGTYNIDKSIDMKGVPTGNGIDIMGAGADKTKLFVANDITVFDCHTNTGVGGTAFNLYGVGFYEKENKMSSMAVKVNSGWVSARNCHFEGLDTGVWFDYAGFSQFTDNTAKSTRVVFEISERSMFLYFDNCIGDACGTLIKAIVTPSGGVSNGILIENCKSTNAFAEDIYITENQAVWITDCEFTGGTGGLAAVYFENHIDSGIDNCIISSAADSNRAGVYYKSVYYGSVTNNEITGCSDGVYLLSSGSATITDNKLSGNTVSDLALRSASRNFISRNLFNSALTMPVIGEKKNTAVSVVGNEFACASYDIAANLGTFADNTVKDNTFNG